MKYYIITFANTHSAIAAKKALNPLFNITVLPTPREIAKGCGIAIRFKPEDYNQVIKKLIKIINKDMFNIYYSDTLKYKLLHHL